jgi:hypothetical protein
MVKQMHKFQPHSIKSASQQIIQLLLPTCQLKKVAGFPVLYSSLDTEYKTEYVRFEDFTAVTMKNGVFWDVMLCGSCNNRRFGGT